MPEQVRCPECNATLRVPDSLLGKNVKCPKCSTTFLAEIDAPAESEGIVREPAPSSRRRPSAPPEEFDDEPPPEEEEDEDRPRRRRRRRGRSSEAESAVAGPAIAMMVVAGLDIFLAILDLLLRLLGFGIYAYQAGAARGRGSAGVPDFLASGVGGIFSDIFGAALAVLILVGALKMKSLSSYALAMTACIVSMLPCHSCCCLGLPFGIWGLVIINKPEVKDAFSS